VRWGTNVCARVIHESLSAVTSRASFPLFAEILEPATSAPGTYLASDRAQQQAGFSSNPYSSVPSRSSSSATGTGTHRIAGDTVIIHIRCKKSDAPFTVVVTGPVSDASVEAIDQQGWAGVAATAPLKAGRRAVSDMPELERTWIEQALATRGNDRDAAIRWLADHAHELITGTGVGAEDATDMLRVSRGIYHGVTTAFELSLHTGQLYLRRREVVPVPQVRKICIGCVLRAPARHSRIYGHLTTAEPAAGIQDSSRL